MWARALEVRLCASYGHFSVSEKVFYNGHYRESYERNIISMCMRRVEFLRRFDNKLHRRMSFSRCQKNETLHESFNSVYFYVQESKYVQGLWEKLVSNRTVKMA